MKKIIIATLILFSANFCFCSNFLDEENGSGSETTDVAIYNTGNVVSQLETLSSVSSGNSQNVVIKELDSTQVLLFYRDGTYYYYRVATVSGNEITGYGNELSVPYGHYWEPIVLDSNHVVASCNQNWAYNGVMLLSISGTTISISGGLSSYPQWVREATTLTSTSFILLTYDPISYTGYVVPCTFTGSSIVRGTMYSLGVIENGTSEMKMSKLNSTKIFVAYQNDGVQELYGKVYTISGGTATGGTAALIHSASVFRFSPVLFTLSQDYVFISYEDTSRYAKIAEIDGTDISYGSAVQISYPWQIELLNSTHLVTKESMITVNNPPYDQYTHFMRIIEISGNEIVSYDITSNITENSYEYGGHNIVALDEENIIAICYDYVSPNYVTYYKYFTFDGSQLLSSELIELTTAEYRLSAFFKDSKYTWLVSQYSSTISIRAFTPYIIGSGTSWDTNWPQYLIKIGTDDINGTGNPDTWFTINKVIDSTTISSVQLNELIDSTRTHVIK